MFRHEAREVVRKAVNASHDDFVVFAGSGCTGAIHKLIDALGIRFARLKIQDVPSDRAPGLG